MGKKWLGPVIAMAVIVVACMVFAQPDINSVNDAPDPVEVPGYNNITADITNATEAWVQISYPNASGMGNYSMSSIGASAWYYNHSYGYPDPLGTYSYVVATRNASGWNTSTGHTFTLQDTTPPNSSVDTLAQYWYDDNVTLTATASDNYHVEDVRFHYRYASDNASWGSWTSIGTDNATPYEISFAFPDGEGYYQFRTRAYDGVNLEPAPATADAIAAYDDTPPSSSVDALPYWHGTTPVTVSATASDGLSGVGDVALRYRYSADNASWGSWTTFATDGSEPWEFSFTAPAGSGYYELSTRATDNATNQEAASGADQSVGIDTTVPTTSKHITGPRYGVYVTSSSVFNFTAGDAQSGVNATYYRVWHGGWTPAPGTGIGRSDNFQLYTGNFSLTGTGLYYLEFYSDDNVGNREPVYNDTQRVDDTPPGVSSIQASPDPQSQGGHVNISCTSIDDAGVAALYVEVEYPDSSTANFTMHYIHCSTYYRNESYSALGTYTYTIYAVDRLGNGVTTMERDFEIEAGGDTTPPDTTATLDPSSPDGPGGWYVSPVRVTLSATDDDTGVDYTKYRIDNGTWRTYNDPFLVSSNGHHQVDFYSVDNAGNVEPVDSVTFKINITVPTTVATFNPASPDGDNGWYLGAVTVNLTASDPDGIDYTKYRVGSTAWQTYTGPFNITTEGVNVLEFYSVDNEGTTEDVKSEIVKIDSEAPAVSLMRPEFGYLYLFDRQLIPLTGGRTVAFGRLTVTAAALDDTSGIDNVTFYVNNQPQNIDLQRPYQWTWSHEIGTKALHVTAADRAGHTATSGTIIVTIFSF
jgi:hypothetical protein